MSAEIDRLVALLFENETKLSEYSTTAVSGSGSASGSADVSLLIAELDRISKERDALLVVNEEVVSEKNTLREHRSEEIAYVHDLCRCLNERLLFTLEDSRMRAILNQETMEEFFATLDEQKVEYELMIKEMEDESVLTAERGNEELNRLR